jgi:hypothetical protein
VTALTTIPDSYGLRILELDLIRPEGTSDAMNFAAPMTLIRGPRNSSKTTTLKMLDFCLGDGDSATRALGARVAASYLALELTISCHGREHHLNRALSREVGPLGRIVVDGRLELLPRELDDWLLDQLGWPLLMIPLGRDPQRATRLQPLTFRSLLRHIYRREHSWLEFATKEEEYLRRGVISFFLGLAESRYSGEDYRLGEVEREVEALGAAVREAGESAAATLQAFTDQFRLPPVAINQLDVLEGQLGLELSQLTRSREQLASEVQSLAGYDPELGSRYEEINAELEKAHRLTAELGETLDGYSHAVKLLDGEQERLKRLVTSIEAFADLPVRLCPACEQSVDPTRSSDENHCYLCDQEVTLDVRQRRAAAEERAIEQERMDLRDVMGRTERELASARLRIADLENSRAEVAAQLNNRRASLLAPFVAQLEAASAAEATIRQQLAAVPVMRQVLARRTELERELAQAHQRLDLARREYADRHVDTQESARRCVVLANRMNKFLSSMTVEPWGMGEISLTPQEMTFYAGRQTWDQALGAESKVLFFFAYSYALLYLHSDLPGQSPAPGLMILDNPYQQGISDDVIAEALDRFSTTARELGVQVIATVAKDVPILGHDNVINMTRQYAGNGSNSRSG